ncbi:MAG: hypothetical protein P4L61_03480, partial [Candidatus Pacebacteria bacterium]|nr:hypothetical protein [Candidatus Paceibacterota bacterium]
MKKNQIVGVVAVIGTCAIAGLPCISIAQQATISYSQTVSLIATFDSEKHYTASTTGPVLDMIFWGMVDNNGAYLSEGLTKRLVGGTITAAKIKTEASAASYAYDGALLELLFYTKENVPVEATDAGLRSDVGGAKGKGTAIKASIANLWKNKAITANLTECLEGYPPDEAVVLVNVISTPWFNSSKKVYENTDATWASQSYQQICHDARMVELAKRSVAVKLLAEQGYVQIPTVTYAVFEWSANKYGYTK